MSDSPLTPRDAERGISLQKNRAIIPALTELANEIEERAANGELRKELRGLKATSLIHNLTKIVAAIKASGPVVVIPQAAAGDGKDPSWFRANSVVNMTEHQRAEMRKGAVDAEIVNEDTPKEGQCKQEPS